MSGRSRAIERAWIILSLCLASVFAHSGAFAEQKAAEQKGKESPCAVLLKYGGQVQILDASRRVLLDTEPRAKIACGSWFSVASGWALIKHRDGHYLHLGSETFAQFTDTGEKAESSGDHLVLYKGQIHADLGDGAMEFRVLTANARSRQSGSGRAIVAYSEYDEETYLISISGKASLENRFQGKRKVQVKAGEATALNSKAMRVVPSTPRAIASSVLRNRLADLHVSENDARSALEAAHGRGNRKLASTLESSEPVQQAPSKSEYARHPPSPADEKLKGRWVNRIVSGAPGAHDLLFPSDRKKSEKEKKQLIEELSKIRPE